MFTKHIHIGVLKGFIIYKKHKPKNRRYEQM